MIVVLIILTGFERSVLEPLRPANADIIEKTLTSAREAISALEKDQEVFGNLFLEQLPEVARSVVISQDPELARRCGFETKRIFRIGTDIILVNSKLFAAAREVLATNKERAVQDNAGKEVTIGLDMEDQNIVVKWSDPAGVFLSGNASPIGATFTQTRNAHRHASQSD